MKLVLDTNIFCQDFRLVGTNFRILRDGVHLVPFDLMVPEIVIDEVANRYKEELEESIVSAQKTFRTIGRLLGRPWEKAITLPEITEESDAYRCWLLEALNSLNTEILPYPEISHKDVVARDLGRKKPFKRSGTGYRDFLIWQTIRDLMLWGHERVVLVTCNTKDFGDGPGASQDLQDDILNPHRLEIVPSLKVFNEEYVLPQLKMLDEAKERLQTVSDASFDIGIWLRFRLLDLLQYEELGPIVTGFPNGVGSVSASDIVTIDSFLVDDVFELSDGEYLVQLSVRAEIDFVVDVDWDDYIHHPEVRDCMGSNPEEFSSSSSHQTELLRLQFNLILDANSSDPHTEELASIDGPYGMIKLSS